MIKHYVVLINLGTPANTRLWTIQKYLFQFLNDPCVIDIPWLYRLLLVGGIIVPFRSFNTRKSYQRIFTEEGSPLMVYSKKLVSKLNERFSVPHSSKQSTVLLAMRYGEPSISKVFETFKKDIRDQKSVQVTFFPLYPQAALSTTETVIREINKNVLRLKKNLNPSNDVSTSNRSLFSYRILPPFYNDSKYLEVMISNIKPFLQTDYDHILFSYHGIPERHLLKYDPGLHCLHNPNCCEDQSAHATESQRYCYRYQVLTTTNNIVKRLHLERDDYSIAFQSRLGKSPWLTPYTDRTIVELAQKGIEKLLVVCPAFVSDNLETLFEIEIENKELFIENGGKELTLIPCLNDRDDWIDFLQYYIEKDRLAK